MEIGVSADMLGRTFDGLGNPIDGLGPILADKTGCKRKAVKPGGP